MKVGDKVEMFGRIDTVDYVENDVFWVEKYPYNEDFEPYTVDRFTMISAGKWRMTTEMDERPTDPTLHTHPTDPSPEPIGVQYYPPDQPTPADPSMLEFVTGALRESKEGRGRPHLVLAGFPRALMALSRHMDCELGRQRNWEKGLPESSLIDSQFRHLMGYVSGVSEDSPEYNLTANVWNAMVMLEEYLRVQDGVMSEEVLDVNK